MNKIKNIYIIDGLLVDFKGHCFAEATALHDAAQKMGIDAQIMGSPKIDKTTALNNNIIPKAPEYSFCLPFYLKIMRKILDFLKPKKEISPVEKKGEKIEIYTEKSSISRKQKIKNIIKKTPLRRFLVSYWINKTIDDFFRNLPVESQSLYLFQTSSYLVIITILRGLLRSKLDLRIVFSSHWKLSQSQINEINKVLNKLKLTVKPVFFWSSAIYVKEHTDMGLCSAKLLPIPQPGWYKYLNIATEKNEHLTLTFLGLSSYNKGFHLLPELIEKVRWHFPQQKFQFDIQYCPLPKLDTHYELIASAYSALQKMDVNLISKALNNEEYYGLLSRSDIMLQPYQTDTSKPHYGPGDTSGILIEAMARGKIPVVPGNTWFSLQVKKFNSGKVFSGNDDFFSKTIEAINEFDSLKSIAESNKEYWSGLHCPEQVIRTIIS